MKSRVSFFLILLASVFSALGCMAFADDWSSIPAKSYLLLPPPPPGSPAVIYDFQKLHYYQNTRSEETCKIAQSQSLPTVKSLFADRTAVISRDELNRVGPFFDRVFLYVIKVGDKFKKKYHRPRPYQVDATLDPCVMKPGGAKAYPSSHSALGTAGACLLAEIFPERLKALRSVGKRIGELRVIGGVHHPSDVMAGRELGFQICRTLLKDPGFQREIAELKRR